MNYWVDIEQIKRDVALVVGSYPLQGPNRSCPLCDSRSAAHYCRPVAEAEARLRAWVGL